MQTLPAYPSDRLTRQSAASPWRSRTFQKRAIERRIQSGGAGIIDKLRAAVAESGGHVPAHDRQCKVIAQVGGSQDDLEKPALRRGDFIRGADARGGFNEGDDLDLAGSHAIGCFRRRNEPFEAGQIPPGLDLRQDDRVQIGANRAFDVVFAETGIQRIDPHAPDRSTQGSERAADACASSGFFPRRRRIFQIENDCVRAGIGKLRDLTLFIGRAEQEASDQRIVWTRRLHYQETLC